MADSKTLKLLLVEDDLEDERLLRHTLSELEEHPEWRNWCMSSVVHVEQLADAIDCLRQEWFDVVLLNLSLPDSPALLDSFFETNACARDAPIVVLADEEDESLANRLLREGAQDVLLKSELDCMPLARSLRYAIERQRRTKALRSTPFLDDLTGTLTYQGFLTIAGHYERLSRHSRSALLMASLEISALPEKTQGDREARELLLIRASEILRRWFEAPALIGRVGRRRFGLITAGLSATTVEALLNKAALEIQDASGGHGRHPATVLFSVAKLDLEASIEELFGEDGFVGGTRQRVKTAMLAD